MARLFSDISMRDADRALNSEQAGVLKKVLEIEPVMGVKKEKHS